MAPLINLVDADIDQDTRCNIKIKSAEQIINL